MEETMNWNYAKYGSEGIEKFGEYVSLIYEEEGIEQEFTNLQIQRQSNALANALRNMGVKRGEVVAAILPNGPAVPVAFTAIFKMGAVFLPIIFALTPAEIRYILKDSQAVTIITDETLYPKVEEASRGLGKIRNCIVKIQKSSIPEIISFSDIISRYPDIPMISRSLIWILKNWRSSCILQEQQAFQKGSCSPTRTSALIWKPV